MVAVDPAGSCGTAPPLRFNYVTGKLWGCDGGTWTQIGGPGAGISGLTTNVIPKAASSTTIANSSVTDDGTTVSTTEPVAIGTSPPTCSPGTGGVWCASEGTNPTAAASVDMLVANSTLHDWAVLANNGVQKLLGSSIGYNSGSVSASIGSTNVASSANFPTGQYHLDCDLIVTAVGSSPQILVTIGWTDIAGASKTATCHTGVVTTTDFPFSQTITSNGSAAITVTQTLSVSTATWQTMIGLTRLQ